MKTLSNHIAIQLTNVTKEYLIHHEKPTLVEKFVKGKTEQFRALDTVTITVKRGEKVGIVGKNGSGKTTLLKIIAGITHPTHGEVLVTGRIVSLIDLNAGFHPDLTGLQNIYLNGMILGLSKTFISHHVNDIIAFADIRQFIDVPLYTYSSGMRLRLGFSVAVHANPDILILDEAIHVGDKSFQTRAKSKIHELFAKQTTLVIVSHDLDFLRKHSRRILVLKNGHIHADGGLELLNKYDRSV